jgi:hypothetical protein
MKRPTRTRSKKARARFEVYGAAVIRRLFFLRLHEAAQARLYGTAIRRPLITLMAVDSA